MAWALPIEVEAQIAPTVTSKETSRIIVSVWAHALCVPHRQSGHLVAVARLGRIIDYLCWQFFMHRSYSTWQVFAE
jgi:hypothetical protein